jgi:hypothetical protein
MNKQSNCSAIQIRAYPKHVYLDLIPEDVYGFVQKIPAKVREDLNGKSFLGVLVPAKEITPLVEWLTSQEPLCPCFLENSIVIDLLMPDQFLPSHGGLSAAWWAELTQGACITLLGMVQAQWLREKCPMKNRFLAGFSAELTEYILSGNISVLTCLTYVTCCPTCSPSRPGRRARRKSCSFPKTRGDLG